MLLLLASAAASAIPNATTSAQTAPQPRAPSRTHHTASASTSGGRTSHAGPASPAPTQRNPPRNQSSAGHGRGDIIFPDSQFKPRFNGRRPNCARRDSTFCEGGVDGYPMVHLNQVLSNSPGIRDYFGNDTLDQNVSSRVLVDRFGMNGEKSLCPSEEKIVFPKMGENADGQWMFIVNLDNDNFQQGIRVELCTKPDQTCLLASGFQDGSNPVCRQKYIYRRLVAVGNGGEAQPDSFKMPSCCVCYVNSEVTSRILRPDPPMTKRRRRRSHHSTQR
uniref:Secreted protein Spatzle n=1 Tax=Gryllus bimaculatus TaxID=6999 RepID=A0A455R926_GRYBI|nr:secreted protein Spatzle [Gryllus bimaculatus]